MCGIQFQIEHWKLRTTLKTLKAVFREKRQKMDNIDAVPKSLIYYTNFMIVYYEQLQTSASTLNFSSCFSSKKLLWIGFWKGQIIKTIPQHQSLPRWCTHLRNLLEILKRSVDYRTFSLCLLTARVCLVPDSTRYYCQSNTYFMIWYLILISLDRGGSCSVILHTVVLVYLRDFEYVLTAKRSHPREIGKHRTTSNFTVMPYHSTPVRTFYNFLDDFTDSVYALVQRFLLSRAINYSALGKKCPIRIQVFLQIFVDNSIIQRLGEQCAWESHP